MINKKKDWPIYRIEKRRETIKGNFSRQNIKVYKGRNEVGGNTVPPPRYMSSPSRAYCFTLNNPTSNDLSTHPLERYVVWQLERGTEGTNHLQGYIELSKPARLAAMRTWLPGAHFEARRGTREQARDYCRKEDSRVEGPFERGTWEAGGSGARNDLLEVKRKLDNNVPMQDIWDEHFQTTLRHYKGFQEYKKIKTGHRTWKTVVTCYWGRTGTGKSRRCLELAPTAYWKTRDEWWDGYEGQEDVILDDFYGWLPWDFLLRLLDRYPLDVNAKGGGRRMVAKRIFLTSNKPPEEWYPNIPDKSPLLRRIENTEYFE